MASTSETETKTSNSRLFPMTSLPLSIPQIKDKKVGQIMEYIQDWNPTSLDGVQGAFPGPSLRNEKWDGETSAIWIFYSKTEFTYAIPSKIDCDVYWFPWTPFQGT